MGLNPLDALRSPLGSKTLALFCFALRAVALTSVLTVIRVSLTTSRFLRVHVSGCCGITQGIFASRNGVQMLRIHTGAMTTSVIHNEPLRNRAIGEKHGDTMSGALRASKEKTPIAILIQTRLPNHAVADALPFLIKPSKLVYGRVAHGWQGWLCMAGIVGERA